MKYSKNYNNQSIPQQLQIFADRRAALAHYEEQEQIIRKLALIEDLEQFQSLLKKEQKQHQSNDIQRLEQHIEQLKTEQEQLKVKLGQKEKHIAREIQYELGLEQAERRTLVNDLDELKQEKKDIEASGRLGGSKHPKLNKFLASLSIVVIEFSLLFGSFQSLKMTWFESFGLSALFLMAIVFIAHFTAEYVKRHAQTWKELRTTPTPLFFLIPFNFALFLVIFDLGDIRGYVLGQLLNDSINTDIFNRFFTLITSMGYIVSFIVAYRFTPNKRMAHYQAVLDDIKFNKRSIKKADKRIAHIKQKATRQKQQEQRVFNNELDIIEGKLITARAKLRTQKSKLAQAEQRYEQYLEEVETIKDNLAKETVSHEATNIKSNGVLTTLLLLAFVSALSSCDVLPVAQQKNKNVHVVNWVDGTTPPSETTTDICNLLPTYQQLEGYFSSSRDEKKVSGNYGEYFLLFFNGSIVPTRHQASLLNSGQTWQLEDALTAAKFDRFVKDIEQIHKTVCNVETGKPVSRIYESLCHIFKEYLDQHSADSTLFLITSDLLEHNELFSAYAYQDRAAELLKNKEKIIEQMESLCVMPELDGIDIVFNYLPSNEDEALHHNMRKLFGELFERKGAKVHYVMVS